MAQYDVILASRSPRRREILSMLGVKFEIVSADADESSEITAPNQLVRELALRKGRATRDLLCAEGRLTDDTLIIASDTVVALGESILGKPEDEEEAREMLRSLSGKSHKVVSGIALLTKDRETAAAEETDVHFSVLSEQEIDRYVKTGEPMDKAGAYAIQGGASIWVEGIDGDYHNVVGLPVHRLNRLLEDFLGIGLLDLT